MTVDRESGELVENPMGFPWRTQRTSAYPRNRQRLVATAYDDVLTGPLNPETAALIGSAPEWREAAHALYEAFADRIELGEWEGATEAGEAFARAVAKENTAKDGF
jgi:hypothetical protein